jgi:hypothetical protein
VTDVFADLAKKSISCIGEIAMRVPSMSKPVVHQLRNFLALKIDYVTTETIIVLKSKFMTKSSLLDVLRKHRKFITEFIPMFNNCTNLVNRVESKVLPSMIKK